MSKGTVFLVGAGPGDPGLLTQRAVELMQYCEVICYDLLVGDAILAHIPAGKTLIPVGYRGYCGPAIEYGMHPEVIEVALAGNNVLRLKAGDPFIFGRATEECLCLQHYGLAYQVVPGITASLGAAIYAGFPLTSSGYASDVTFASGHRSSRTVSNWAALGQSSGTLVLYMGAKKIAMHAAQLISEGKPETTPVAVIAAATSARQRVLNTTLAEVTEQIPAFDNGDPMLVIVGEVVSLQEQLAWRSQLALHGQQICVHSRDEGIKQQLKLAGAVLISPFQELELTLRDEHWQALQSQSHLNFIDVDSAQAFLKACIAHHYDIRQWHWQLSGSEAVQQWFAERGLQIQPLQLNVFNLDKAHPYFYQDQVCAPSYPLTAIQFALIDELAVACYMKQHELLLDQAWVMTTKADLVLPLQQLGLKVALTEHAAALESFLAQLPALTLAVKCHAA